MKKEYKLFQRLLTWRPSNRSSNGTEPGDELDAEGEFSSNGFLEFFSQDGNNDKNFPFDEDISQDRIKYISNRFDAALYDFAEDFKRFHDEEMRRAKEYGARDGHHEVPESNTQLPHSVESEITESYCKKCKELFIQCEPRIHDLESLSKKAKIELDELTDQKIAEKKASIEESFDEKLKALDSKYKAERQRIEQDPKLIDVSHRMDKLEDEYDDMSRRLGRKDTNTIISIKKWLYFLLLILIGGAEVTAVYLAFLAFEEPQILTWVWAVLVGLVIGAGAHFVGLLLRTGNRERWGHWLAAFVLLLVTVVAIWSISIIRSEEVPINIKDTSLTVFFAISGMLSLLGATLAFTSHDTHPEFEKLLKEREKNRKLLVQMLDRMVKQRTALEKVVANHRVALLDDKNRQIEKMSNIRVHLRKILQSSKESLTSMKNKLDEMVDKICNCHGEAIHLYRSENLRYRKTPPPPYWDNPITLECCRKGK